jgi:hypothetical protein
MLSRQASQVLAAGVAIAAAFIGCTDILGIRPPAETSGSGGAGGMLGTVSVTSVGPGGAPATTSSSTGSTTANGPSSSSSSSGTGGNCPNGCMSAPLECLASPGTCMNGNCTYNPKSMGTPCSNGGHCNGSGTCVVTASVSSSSGGGCLSDMDCSLQNSECTTYKCISNTCSPMFASPGTALSSSSQVHGDCQKLVCNGNGGVTSQPDDTDLPVYGDPCKIGICSVGVPSYTGAPAATPCFNGFCDGNGNCVPSMSGSSGSLMSGSSGSGSFCPGGCMTPPNNCYDPVGVCIGPGSCHYNFKQKGTKCGAGSACDGNGNCIIVGPPCTAGSCGAGCCCTYLGGTFCDNTAGQVCSQMWNGMSCN